MDKYKLLAFYSELSTLDENNQVELAWKYYCKSRRVSSVFLHLVFVYFLPWSFSSQESIWFQENWVILLSITEDDTLDSEADLSEQILKYFHFQQRFANSNLLSKVLPLLLPFAHFDLLHIFPAQIKLSSYLFSSFLLSESLSSSVLGPLWFSVAFLLPFLWFYR